MYKSYLALLGVVIAVAGCEVEQKQEGKLPEVEVTEEGQLPKYDVKGPDVDVQTEQKDIGVPKVDVYTEEKQIEVPTGISVQPPPDTDKPKQ